MLPVILDDGGSGSFYLKEEIADILGLDTDRKVVLAAKSIVKDSNTKFVPTEYEWEH